MLGNTSLVTIDLTTHPPQTPLGMLLAPSADANTPNNSTLVAGWEHLPEKHSNTTLGPIQRSGMVRLGDRLVRINGRDVTDWSFAEVMDTLRHFLSGEDGKRLKSLGFAPRNSQEWSRHIHNRQDILLNVLEDGRLVHEKRSYSFASYVTNNWRVVVDDDGAKEEDATYNGIEHDIEEHLNKEPIHHSNSSYNPSSSSSNIKSPKPYIQYEIQCHLVFHTKSFRKPSSSTNNTHVWSIWKRYSQFRELDTELRTMHGWQMNALEDGRGIVFPRERYLETFWYDVYYGVKSTFFTVDDTNTTQHANRNDCPYPLSFIVKRQKELTIYWSQLMRIEEMFEFDVHNHKFSNATASFLQVDQILLKRSQINTPSVVSGGMKRNTPAVIHEEDVVNVSELILPSTNVPSREDDDVSLLSDGTGLRDGNSLFVSPLRNAQQKERVCNSGSMVSTGSMVSGSTVNSGVRRVGARSGGAIPAFQRKYLGV